MGTHERLCAQADELHAAATAALEASGRQNPQALTELAGRLEQLAAELGATLRAGTSTDPARVARALVRLTRAGCALQEDAVTRRFEAVVRIHDSLSRLREVRDVGELLTVAAEEMARCCDLDRTVVSRRRGATWRAEAVWIDPAVEPVVAARTRAYLTEQWIPLRPGTLEHDLMRRRTAALVSSQDPGVDRELVDTAESVGYIACPVMPSGEVIGFLQGDRFLGTRELTVHDRDNLWTFAEGFGLIFQHLVLSERLRRQRTAVQEAFAAAEEGLLEIDRDELLLTRREAAAPAPGGRPAVTTTAGVLSRREREVLELMVAGARNREIADRLVISESTVKAHVSRVTKKLKAANRADAVSRFLLLERGRAGAR
jgi:LuxR family transcriptional regulator, regulator of acetate metabolism